MSNKPEFAKDGYQKELGEIAGEPLPGKRSRRLSSAEQEKLGIPSPAAVLEALRSKPRRGTPSRTESALPARQSLRLNQRDFARLIGTSSATIRNWEQRRTPIPKMARKLLRVVERHPAILADLAEVDSAK